MTATDTNQRVSEPDSPLPDANFGVTSLRSAVKSVAVTFMVLAVLFMLVIVAVGTLSETVVTDGPCITDGLEVNEDGEVISDLTCRRTTD